MPAADLLEFLIIRMIRKRRKRFLYIRNIFRNRLHQGEMQLVNELSDDFYYHHRYFRMNKETFQYLVNKIRPRIQHKRNHLYPISEEMRLAIALRYLASGSSQISLAMNYRVSPSAIGKILKETLSAIWEELVEEFMPIPDQNALQVISEQFWDLWNFPHCCGALDGKHIRMKNLPKTGSENFNYKHYYSRLLLISADATYKITYCDIGACGSASDIGVLENSIFGKRMLSGQLPMPEQDILPDSEISCPYVFISDGGFPLKENIMKPYPIDSNINDFRKTFNYRLCRARRVAENAFGIMAARFRIFHTEIEAGPELVDAIVKAAVVLHNFLMTKSELFELTPDTDRNGELVLGNWREINLNDRGYVNATQLGSNNYTRSAEQTRNTFATYFNSPAHSLAWQNNVIRRGR